MKDELTKATVNFIRHCYGDGEATIRRDILKALRTGKTIDSPMHYRTCLKKFQRNSLRKTVFRQILRGHFMKRCACTRCISKASNGVSTRLQGQRRRFKMIQE